MGPSTELYLTYAHVHVCVQVCMHVFLCVRLAVREKEGERGGGERGMWREGDIVLMCLFSFVLR